MSGEGANKMVSGEGERATDRLVEPDLPPADCAAPPTRNHLRGETEQTHRQPDGRHTLLPLCLCSNLILPLFFLSETKSTVFTSYIIRPRRRTSCCSALLCVPTCPHLPSLWVPKRISLVERSGDISGRDQNIWRMMSNEAHRCCC